MKTPSRWTYIVFAALSPLLLAQQPVQLGVNLDGAGAFVNIVNQTNRYSNAAGYDSLGWPTSDFDLVLMDGRPATEWTGAIDDPEQYRVDYSGRYACSFTGSGTVRASGTAVSIENTSYDAVSNTTVFDIVVGGYPNANHGLVFLNFTSTRRSPSAAVNTGVTDLKVHRPGYPLNTNKVFTDEYIALCRAAEFACYRFYNVQNIWDGEPAYPAVTRWQNRKTPRDAAQTSMSASNGKRDGWCWEHMIALANILKKDIWICVHMSCDSTYVAQLAALLRNTLDPAVNIYVENSNEVWSPTQATHGPYNQADAQARGITFDQNYARRTVELSGWFGAVFGAQEINNRIRVILAGQHAYNGRSDNHLAYIRGALGEPKDFIYATSTALYFGSTKASSTNPADINDGMFEDIAAQIGNAQSATYRLNHITKANTWGFKGGCTSYEGGPHLPAGGGTANLSAQILAHRTPAMGDVLKRNYREGWRDLGGGLAMYFTLVSGYNRYGCWGITDDYTKPDRNYKMRAIREMTAANTAVDERTVPPDEYRITASPNPFSSSLRIDASASALLRITDILGREVWLGNVRGTARVDTRAWSPGVYLLRCEGRVLRVLKQ
ncbi:MAG: T9SS type A sorting domain-containing protein [Ignavibacteria bacterium]|nr:T9SS type A sorting domain-containing protein [Ignavibacteria bacterium]